MSWVSYHQNLFDLLEVELPVSPAAVQMIKQPPKSFFNAGKLMAPKFIPKKVEQIKEQAPPPAEASGVVITARIISRAPEIWPVTDWSAPVMRNAVA